MSKFDKRKMWACLVAGLLAIIAVGVIDIALILNDGIAIEVVMDEGNGEVVIGEGK